jgi:hypothetical protein
MNRPSHVCMHGCVISVTRHAIWEQMVWTGQENIQKACLSKWVIILEAAATLGVDPDAPMKLVIFNNEIAEGNYKQNHEVPIKMSDSEKNQYNNYWRTYWERNVLLMKHRGQAFSPILCQCTQLLQDRMKQDTNWNTDSTSYNPLALYWLIEKTMLVQSLLCTSRNSDSTYSGRRQCPTCNGMKNSTQRLMLDQLSA